MAEPAWVLRTRRARAHRYRSRRRAPPWHRQVPPITRRQILPIRLAALIVAPLLRLVMRSARAQHAFVSACAARATLEGLPFEPGGAGWPPRSAHKQQTGVSERDTFSLWSFLNAFAVRFPLRYAAHL